MKKFLLSFSSFVFAGVGGGFFLGPPLFSPPVGGGGGGVCTAIVYEMSLRAVARRADWDLVMGHA